MNIFAMDTSSLTATVAVLTDEKLLGEFSVSNKLTHSQTIMPMTDTLLIGMATVKTFAQALDKPIIGVSSLAGVAHNFSFTDAVICPMMDARRNEVYNSLYKNGKEIVSPRALHIDELLEELKNEKVIFAGDAVLVHADKLKNNENWTIAPQHLLLPKASSLAYEALEKAKNGNFDDLYTLNPVYLRKSQAEREREERLKNEK